jgi:uncharacterized protein
MGVSAYLEAGRILGDESARRFALITLDRLLNEAWDGSGGLRHVIAYGEGGEAASENIHGSLDDYAMTVHACVDAWIGCGKIRYYEAGIKLADAMVAKFYDRTGGAFFDSPMNAEGVAPLGALTARRKPLQDSPTPAGNPMAAIALLRLHHYTGEASYREKAEQTLELFAGVGGQFGIFAATYGIAVTHFLENPVQVVIVSEDGSDSGMALQRAAKATFAFNKSTIRLSPAQAVAGNLPPALAATIPHLPNLHSGKAFAVLCSGFSCQPPIYDADELNNALRA